MNINEKYKEFYKILKNYIEIITPKNINVNDYLINKMSPYDDLNAITKIFFGALQDYYNYPNIIGFWKDQRRTEKFQKVLFDFDAKKILKEYNEKTLYDAFLTNYLITSSEGTWRKYTQAVLSACSYLSHFNNADEFNEHVLSYNGSLDIIYELKNQIYGMGFAVACNCIKDLGFVNYVKPDVHLIDVCYKTGLSTKKVEDVFYVVKEIAEANNDTPFNVDRMIWLVCSGNFFKDNYEVISRKEEFIKEVNKAIN